MSGCAAAWPVVAADRTVRCGSCRSAIGNVVQVAPWRAALHHDRRWLAYLPGEDEEGEVLDTRREAALWLREQHVALPAGCEP